MGSQVRKCTCLQGARACVTGHLWASFTLEVVMILPAMAFRHSWDHRKVLWGVSVLSLILASVSGDLNAHLLPV